MAPLQFDAARREIGRGDIAHVYYVTGSEDMLKDELVSAVVDATLDPASRDFNLDVRSAADLDGESLNALIETSPMLAERRVVVLRGLEQWRRNAKVWDVLRRYLRAPAPGTVLLLLHGDNEVDPGIAAASTHVEPKPLAGDELREWASARAASRGIRLLPDALAHLVEAVGDDLAQLASEMDKLAAALGGERPVTTDQVAAFVGIRHGETLQDWVTAVLERDVVRAVALVEVVLPQSGVTAVRMVTALGTELVGLRLAAALAAQGTAGGRLKQALLQELRAARPSGVRDWSERAQSWANAVTRWTLAELDAAIEAAFDADVALKSTTVSDERGILRGLVLSLRRKEVAA